MKMQLIFLLLVFSFLGINPANGQKNITKDDMNQYMVYSQDIGNSYAHWYLVYNNHYRISATFSKIYLLNKHNIRVDSVEISSNSNRNPIQLLEVIDNVIVGHTMQKSFVLGVKDNQLHTINTLDYKLLDKKWNGYDHFLFTGQNEFFGYSRSMKKNEIIKVLTLNGTKESKVECSTHTIKNSGLQLAGSFLQISEDFILFNLSNCGKSFGFDSHTGDLTFTYINPFENLEFKFITYDPFIKKIYSIYKKENKYLIIALNDQYFPSELVAISEFQPIKISNEKIHFIFGFEGIISHALVPIKDNEAIPFFYFNLD
ncbi:hypothetical protein Belba_3596 [Belliella baltica DSM 15883]|uniref:Uncharacterized protein n=1 Tax=Belliella baltica (strain DSM 15883 / CIP 108006 / LMG 21964 / BA134) TaxID=866536 RepID=I3ZA22_BELBD|nr:hypothetical protein [Belliella baltica]AFL86090.1 hypothetical protein Belba_3596 [Belliella baltica DSM 15883]